MAFLEEAHIVASCSSTKTYLCRHSTIENVYHQWHLYAIQGMEVHWQWSTTSCQMAASHCQDLSLRFVLYLNFVYCDSFYGQYCMHHNVDQSHMGYITQPSCQGRKPPLHPWIRSVCCHKSQATGLYMHLAVRHTSLSSMFSSCGACNFNRWYKFPSQCPWRGNAAWPRTWRQFYF